MRQTRKLRGGATPSQIRANQTRSSSKSGRRLSRKVKGLYRTPAADYFEMIMGEIKEDAKALKKMDKKIRKEEELERKTNMYLAQLFGGLGLNIKKSPPSS